MKETGEENLRLIKKAQQIYDILVQHFGIPEWRQSLDAMDELISTILSQNTNDRNRDIAFFALKTRFSTWDEVRDADLVELIDVIRPAGLANQKGARIQVVLQQISAERGDLNLDFLKHLSAEEVQTWLLRFKGVGLKTASIVMQFALGIPAFPVDTHVYRVSGRLGLRSDSMNVNEAHGYLSSLFPPENYGAAHLNLIRLGREICSARKPDCEHCPLTVVCDYYQRLPR